MTLLFAQIFQTTSLFPETKLIWTPKMEFHECYIYIHIYIYAIYIYICYIYIYMLYIYIYIYIMICLINSKIPKIELYKHEK